MRKLIILAILIMFAFSTTAFAKGGHYSGGKGSSHKGGHYRNSATHNHYQKHR